MNAPMIETAPGAAPGTEGQQVVVFSLAGCECAVGIGEVREIDRVADLTRMPRAPRFVAGVLNLRGRVVPVLDLRRRFNMPRMDRTQESRILIAEVDKQWVGLLADRVAGVVRAQPSSIVPVEGPILSVEPQFLKGCLPLEDRLILLLDLEKLFALGPGKALLEAE